MDKTMILTLLILLAFFSCFLGYKFIPVFLSGIEVKYQRNTGPDFIVIKGAKKIRAMAKGRNLDYSELFSSEDLDVENGFLNPNFKYIICGDLIKTNRKIISEQKYPTMKVEKLVRKMIYQVQGLSFILCILSFLYLLNQFLKA